MFGEGEPFKLPIVDASVTPQAAVDKLIKSNLSALVVRTEGQLHVLDEDFLVNALAANAKRLDLAEAIIAGSTVVRLAASAAPVKPGFVGLFQVEGGQFQASHRYLASRYLSPSRIVRCANVLKPHYYPPYVLAPKDREHCVICKKPILHV